MLDFWPLFALESFALTYRIGKSGRTSWASLVLRLQTVCQQCGKRGFDPSVGKTPWKRAWQPTPGFLPGESHGQRSLAGYSPWGLIESDMTDRLIHTHTHTDKLQAGMTGHKRFTGYDEIILMLFL